MRCQIQSSSEQTFFLGRRGMDAGPAEGRHQRAATSTTTHSTTDSGSFGHWEAFPATHPPESYREYSRLADGGAASF